MLLFSYIDNLLCLKQNKFMIKLLFTTFIICLFLTIDSSSLPHNQSNIDSLQSELTRTKNELKASETTLNTIREEKHYIQTLAIIGGSIATVLIAVIIFYQRRKSEQLLYTILPQKIAKRLKGNKDLIADDYKNISIVFMDLVGFTAFAKEMPAADVVKILNEVFHRLDDLCTLHNLEKIKTMGDGYMAAAGVPEPDEKHAINIVNFALAARDVIAELDKKSPMDLGARLGIESGPVVAGVIGKQKFIYDLWGDSVNTASRMESTGIPGKVQISENVKSEIEKHSNEYVFFKRDPINVKGRGIMQTYLVELK